MANSRMMRLEYLSVKPYFTWKNLLFFVIGAAVYGLAFRSIDMLYFVGLFTVNAIAAFPFVVGEETGQGLDVLYRLFGWKPNAVVKGRYFFAALMVLVVDIVLSALAVGLSLYLKETIRLVDVAVRFLGVFGGATWLYALQYPLLFQRGYAKAKTILIVPPLALSLISYGIYRLFPEAVLRVAHWGERYPVRLGAAIAMLWAVGMGISYLLSSLAYRRREF